MLHPDHGWLSDIFMAARKIREITADRSRAEYEADDLRVLSVERLLITIGEAAKQVSPHFRARHPEIPWRPMAGMRDLVVHAYRKIDQDEVWKAISQSIPELLEMLKPLVPADDELNAGDS